MKTRLVSLGMFLTLAFTSVVAQDATAVTVLALARSAMLPRGTAPQDSVAEGAIALSSGQTGEITIKHQVPNALRTEVVLEGKVGATVISSGRGHHARDGKQSGLPLWVTQYHGIEHLPALSRINDINKPNIQVTYLGTETVGGRTAHHIQLVALPGEGESADIEALLSEFHIFVDAATFYVLKTRGRLFSDEIIENHTTIETYYSDYRLVAGVMVPFRITQEISGKPAIDIALKSIRFDVGLPTSDFQSNPEATQ